MGYKWLIQIFVMFIMCGQYAYGVTEITNCDGLQNIRDNLSETYIITKLIDCKDKKFIPIGSGTAPFTGVLISSKPEYVITNLTIRAESTAPVGIFHTIKHAAIDKISIINAKGIGVNLESNGLGGDHSGLLAGTAINSRLTNIRISDSLILGHDYVGAVVGLAHGGSFDHIDVKYTRVGGCNSLGGLVGMSGEQTSITNSNVRDSEISFAWKACSSVDGHSAGGLVWYLDNGYIENGIAHGNVASIIDNAGGLVGTLSGGSIKSSVVKHPKVRGVSEIGGIVGSASGIIENSCIEDGGLLDGDMVVGWMVGHLTGDGKKIFNKHCSPGQNNFGEVLLNGSSFVEVTTNPVGLNETNYYGGAYYKNDAWYNMNLERYIETKDTTYGGSFGYLMLYQSRYTEFKEMFDYYKLTVVDTTKYSKMVFRSDYGAFSYALEGSDPRMTCGYANGTMPNIRMWYEYSFDCPY